MSKGTCKAASCGKDVRAKGYCTRHYAQWRKGKLPKPRYKTCHQEGCRKRVHDRGLCEEHFASAFKKKGAAEAPAAAG